MIREFFRSLRDIWSHSVGRSILLSLIGLFATGTVFYRLIEGWPWIDAFYFTAVTLTTVGYGDLAPTTTASKLFTVLLILSGVGAILAFLEALVRHTVQRRTGKAEAE
jgi:voltage-gated potassium channel